MVKWLLRGWSFGLWDGSVCELAYARGELPCSVSGGARTVEVMRAFLMEVFGALGGGRVGVLVGLCQRSECGISRD